MKKKIRRGNLIHTADFCNENNAAPLLFSSLTGDVEGEVIGDASIPRYVDPERSRPESLSNLLGIRDRISAIGTKIKYQIDEGGDKANDTEIMKL